jgi:hypothetical protein
MRSLLATSLVLTFALASAGAAQVPASRTVAVWSTTGSDLRELERAALGVARAALPGAPRVESTCYPTGAGCITSMLRGTRATHVLGIRVHWGRGGCVPMLGPSGERTGTRMLRVRVVDLELYAAGGALLGSREVRVASETDVAPIDAALAELLAL